MAVAAVDPSETSPPESKPRGRRFQFSLRTALLVMLLASIFFAGFAWWRNRAERQRNVVAELRELGANVDYGYFVFFERNTGVRPTDEFFVVSRLRNLLGDDFVSNVRAVRYNHSYFHQPIPRPADRRRAVKLVKQLPRLEMLDLNADVSPQDLAEFPFLETIKWMGLYQRPNTWTDADLAPFEKCGKLKGLSLANQPIDGSGLVHLHNCKNLRHLFLWRSNVGDAALVHLTAMTSLENLDLSETKVTDAGIAKAELPQSLQRLELGKTAIGDGALEGNIAQLPNLIYVSLDKTQVTEQGVERFKKYRRHGTSPGKFPGIEVK